MFHYPFFNFNSKLQLVRHWLAPALASVGFAGLVATFAVEMGSFRRAVEEWATRDLTARTELAAANLREPLRTGDFKSLYAFGSACESEGLQLTVFSAGGGVFYNSRNSHPSSPIPHPLSVYAAAKSGEFSVRLGLPRARVLAPFHRARLGFLLAALAGGAGMLLVFFFTYRQHVRIRELARLEKFRREFVADVSHELKTPLTGILGAVDLLQEEDKGRKAEGSVNGKLISLISREAKRLDSLAQGILDLARLERADEAIHKTQTDIGELVQDVVESFQPQADKQGITTAVHLSPSLLVSCDPQLISRAMSNLVGNAIRHSGSRDVVVSIERVGRDVRIAVEDHGKGIPQEEAKRVFERFHRIDPARAVDTGGAGLGLAIVRSIAQLHGGDVTLSAVSPSGCRFTLSLPS